MNVKDENIFETIYSYVDAANYSIVHAGYTALSEYLIPIVITAMGCSLIIFCIQAAWGGHDKPIATLLQKCLKWGAMAALVLSWEHFNVWFYEVFTNGPVHMGNMMIDAIRGADGCAKKCGDESLIDGLNDILIYGHVAAALAKKGGSGYVMPWILYVTIHACTYIVAIVAFFTLMLAKVGTALMLFIAPIPLFAFMFDTTRDIFTRWIQQLLNFTMISVLVSALLAMFMQLLLMAMPDINEGLREIKFADIGATIIVSGIMVLLLLQVPGQAASLGGGIQLTTMGAYSAVTGNAKRLAGSTIKATTAGAKAAGSGIGSLATSTLGKLKAVKGG